MKQQITPEQFDELTKKSSEISKESLKEIYFHAPLEIKIVKIIDEGTRKIRLRDPSLLLMILLNMIKRFFNKIKYFFVEEYYDDRKVFSVYHGYFTGEKERGLIEVHPPKIDPLKEKLIISIPLSITNEI